MIATKKTIAQFEKFLRGQIDKANQTLSEIESISLEDWGVEQHNNKWQCAREIIQESESALRMIALFNGGKS